MAAQPSPIMGLMQNPGSIPRPTRSAGSGTCAKSVTTAAGAAHGATHDDFKITSKTATNINLMASAVAASEDDGHQDGSSSLRREHDGLDAAVEPNDAITASERDDPALDVSFSSVQEEPDAGASPARDSSCSVHQTTLAATTDTTNQNMNNLQENEDDADHGPGVTENNATIDIDIHDASTGSSSGASTAACFTKPLLDDRGPPASAAGPILSGHVQSETDEQEEATESLINEICAGAGNAAYDAAAVCPNQERDLDTLATVSIADHGPPCQANPAV